MSDVDTLIVMFQAQLSDVMETLVKTAMSELTRLVEDGLVEEVRRRTRDVESLRGQLQWAEKKLCDAAGDSGETTGASGETTGSSGTPVRCVDCGKALCRDDGTDEEEEEGEEGEESAADLLQFGVLMGCDMKQEDDAMELCTRIHGQEVMAELTQDADVPVLVLSPERESGTMDQDDGRPVVDVKKEEETNEPSCSAEHAGDWTGGVGSLESHGMSSGTHGMSESHGMSEWPDAQQRPEQTTGMSEDEELLRTIIRQEDPHTHTHTHTHTHHPVAHTRTGEDRDETRTLYACMVTEPSDVVSPFDMDSTQVTSLTTNCETAAARAVAPKQTPVLSLRGGRDHVVSSSDPPPRARQQFADGVGTVVIKEEIMVNSDEGEEEEEEEEMMMRRPGLSLQGPPSSFTVHQYAGGGPDVLLKQGNVSHKPKLHSKVGSSTMLKATAPHTPHHHHHHQTGRRPTAHSLASNSARRPSSDANLNLQHRTPTTVSSKGAPPPPPPPPLLSFQRAQNEPNNKRSLGLTRASSIPWVSIKTHHHQQHHQSALNSQNHLLGGGGGGSTHSSGSSHSHHLLRCGQCGKCFPHPSNLKAHLQTHTGERPFCCSLCGRSFTKLSNLKAHRRVHTGERPYCCLACGKRFTQKCNLKRHQRIHIDV